MAGQIWEVEDKMGTETCYTREGKKTRPPCGWLAVKYSSSHMLVLLSALIEWGFLCCLNPHDVAIVALMILPWLLHIVLVSVTLLLCFYFFSKLGQRSCCVAFSGRLLLKNRELLENACIYFHQPSSNVAWYGVFSSIRAVNITQRLKFS